MFLLGPGEMTLSDQEYKWRDVVEVKAVRFRLASACTVGSRIGQSEWFLPSPFSPLPLSVRPPHTPALACSPFRSPRRRPSRSTPARDAHISKDGRVPYARLGSAILAAHPGSVCTRSQGESESPARCSSITSQSRGDSVNRADRPALRTDPVQHQGRSLSLACAVQWGERADDAAPSLAQVGWTAITLLVFLVCSQIPLYGIVSSDSSGAWTGIDLTAKVLSRMRD